MALQDAYELAYREAVRTLEHQRATLAELRSRASLLLAAASISISLLGNQSAPGTPTSAWAVILCFALLCLCVLTIVWPNTDWQFDVDPQALLRVHLSASTPNAAAMSTDLIAHITICYGANGRRIALMSSAFRVGSCLLAIQLVLTLVAATVTV